MAGKDNIPTAEQEALQDPQIDPTFLLATGISEGPLAALKSLVGLVGQNAAFQGIPPVVRRLAGYGVTPRGAGAVERGVGQAYDALKQKGNPPAKYGPMTRRFKPTGRNYASYRAAKHYYDSVPDEDFDFMSMYEPTKTQRLMQFLSRHLADDEQGARGAMFAAYEDRAAEIAKKAAKAVGPVTKIPVKILSEAE